MPPPNKPPPQRPEPAEDTDPGAPLDMLQTGSMKRLPRKPAAFPKPPPPKADGEAAPAEVAGERTLVVEAR